MLDAAASGLPVIANHTITASERLDGNGVIYKLEDLSDLIRVLESLREPGIRNTLGMAGASKMARDFSWARIALQRLQDYSTAAGGAFLTDVDTVHPPQEQVPSGRF